MIRILIFTIAIVSLGCATPNISAKVTDGGIDTQAQFCWSDSDLGKNMDKYTGGLLTTLMGCP
jgi:hypothetical protein